MGVLGSSTLNFPASGFTIGDGTATSWMQGNSSKQVGLGIAPTEKFQVNGNIKGSQVRSLNGYYGFNGDGLGRHGMGFTDTGTSKAGYVSKYDPISGIFYDVHEEFYSNISCWNVVGTFNFQNATTTQVFIDLRPYLQQSYAYTNYVLVQASGIWVSADNLTSYYVSRICSMSFYYNENVATPTWQRSNLDSPFADQNDSTNFPVSNRIYPLLWNDVTGGTTAGSGGVLTPQIRFYRRAAATTTGTCYYTYRLFVLNG